VRKDLFFIVSIALLVLACGGAEHPVAKAPAKNRASSGLAQRPPAGTLWRHEVNAVVDGGLGRFLQFLFARLEVAPLLDGRERFVGWEVVRLHPARFWEGIDLREGDVVTSVNGKPIERDTQAYDAFQSLKTADELVIALLRRGERMELVFKIAVQPGRSSSPGASSPPPSGAAGSKRTGTAARR
jgi:type II secretory pathway component PulC